MLGILLIDKPAGITSHDVVNTMRRRLGLRRVGHAGTLDPQATGALVVAIGPATRFLQYLPLEPKEYEGTILFGVETDSQDAEGAVVAERPVPFDLEAQIAEALPRLVGEIEQIPPMYSAVKQAGKPLYKYARQGETVEREPRVVYVDVFEASGFDGPRVGFRVVCSGGTYVRTLAHDLGQAIGCGAHLTALRRTRVGRFALGEAVPLDTAGREHLIPLREALPPMPMLATDENETRRIREGQAIRSRDLVGQPRLAALLDPDGNVYSVARVQGDVLHPECVIPPEALLGSI